MTGQRCRQGGSTLFCHHYTAVFIEAEAVEVEEAAVTNYFYVCIRSALCPKLTEMCPCSAVGHDISLQALSRDDQSRHTTRQRLRLASRPSTKPKLKRLSKLLTHLPTKSSTKSRGAPRLLRVGRTRINSAKRQQPHVNGLQMDPVWPPEAEIPLQGAYCMLKNSQK